MKKDFSSPAKDPEKTEQYEQPISAFRAEQKEYGFRITVAGRVKLQPALNMPAYVIGTIELDDQIVPVIDTKAQSGPEVTEITEQSCIVLFEHKIGQTSIITGRLFESARQVFDLIVNYMELSDDQRKLYIFPEVSIALHKPAQ